MIVSKVLQNIANNAQFSTKKEAFMAPMNPVVQAHQPVVQAFLTEMANPVRVANWQQPCLVGIFFFPFTAYLSHLQLGPPLEEPAPTAQPHPDLRGVTYLHSQLYTHMGKVQELVTASAGSEADLVMDELMMAVAMLPPPSATAKPPASSPAPAAASPPASALNRESG